MFLFHNCEHVDKIVKLMDTMLVSSSLIMSSARYKDRISFMDRALNLSCSLLSRVKMAQSFSLGHHNQERHIHCMVKLARSVVLCREPSRTY